MKRLQPARKESGCCWAMLHSPSPRCRVPGVKGHWHAMRTLANEVLQGNIRHLLRRPVGRPPKREARSPSRLRLPGPELGHSPAWSPRCLVGTRVSYSRGSGSSSRNLRDLPPAGVTHFYNGRGTAEQWIKEGKYGTGAALVPTLLTR